MIQVEKLHKYFGEKHAVADVSFEVPKGTVFGLLGPNGAGKSTTMRIVTGCLRPSLGRVKIRGYDVWKSPRQAKSALGFLPESAPSYGELSVREFISYLASIRGMRGGEKAKAIDRVVELCYLREVQHQIVDTLSKGYRHRICLAQSLVHDPEVIVFDEPTDGLDPNQKREIRLLIHEIRARKAIILSTHILDEVDAVCTDVVVLNQGRIIETGTPSQLKEQAASRRELNLCIEDASLAELEAGLKCLTEVKSVTVKEKGHYVLHTKAKTHAERESLARKVYQLLQQKSWSLTHFSFTDGSLEEVFRDLTLGEDNQSVRSEEV